MSTIKQRQEADEEDSIGDKDYMGDFVSEEYVTKNIRVMPMGGLSIDNQSEHTSKYYASGMGAGGGTVDSDAEETKYNRDEYLEMMNRRAVVKEKKLEAERKAQEEAEREAKLKQKLK